MAEVRVDRWWNLVGTPGFLAPITPSEHVWWRPAATIGLMAPLGLVFCSIALLAAGLVNTWLIQLLVLAERPSWPANLFDAATSSRVKCTDCLLGGVTETVLVGVISLGALAAVLVAVMIVYRRPAISWITGAPRFRWRLFWIGLVLFGLVFGAVASVPEALHGWRDPPVFLKAGEAVRMQIVYVIVMLVALPVAAAFEEVLCRGWLLQVTAAFSRSLPAILLFNSLVFSLLHVDPDPGRNLARAVLGMALSWGALRTGGLEIGIGVHAANNLVVLMLSQTLLQSEKIAASTPLSVVVELVISLAAVGVIELVARWGPLRQWSGLDGSPQPIHRANRTLAAP